jgi:hypothetical protein
VQPLTPLEFPTFRWSAVLAGAFVALGIWFVLHLVGMGIGLIAIDPRDTSTLRSVGLGKGIWSLVAPLFALFLGGLVAARVAGPISRLVGAIHGAVLWSLATIAAVFSVVWIAGALAGGVGNAATTAAHAAGVDIGALGFRGDELVGPMNERLQAEGKAPVTAEQLTAAAG